MWRAAQAARCVEIPAPSHEGVLISALERCKVKDKNVKVKYGGLAITGCAIDESALIDAPRKNFTLEKICRAFDVPVSAAREIHEMYFVNTRIARQDERTYGAGLAMQASRMFSGKYKTRDMVAAK